MDSKTETPTASEMRERLIAKATTDEAFRARLLTDPKGAVQDELGLAIPAGFTINVHEEAADTGHLVLPPPAGLDEADLQQAAGGAGNWVYRSDGSRYWQENDQAITFWDDW